MSSVNQSAKEKRLGLNAAITRRDFIGSTLLGAGGALLAASAPALAARAASTRAASTEASRSFSLGGLDAAWTGPGGIGDYGGANGNTHQIVNTGHALFTGEFAGRAGEAEDSGETYDLVVVGGGFSGLTAAYHYRQRRPSDACLILENHAIFGGHAKQNEFDVDGVRLWAPQGSEGHAGPRAIAARMGLAVRYWDELGLPHEDGFQFQEITGTDRPLTAPVDRFSPMNFAWERADVGYFFANGKNNRPQWAVNPWNNGFADTPYSDRYKRDLLTAELFRKPPLVDDVGAYLDSMTYLEYLTDVVGVAPQYANYVDKPMAAMGCGLGADVTSAYTAKSFFQPGLVAFDIRKGYPDAADVAALVSFPGGNCGIARHFVKALIPGVFPEAKRLNDVLTHAINWRALDNPGQAVRMRLNATVVNVEHEGSPDSAKWVNVVYLHGGKLHTVKARRVVMACEQHVNKHIVKGLPEQTVNAMHSLVHAPMLTVNVAVRNWKFMEKLGITAARWDEGFGWWTCVRRQMIIDGKEPMPLNPSKPTVLTLYIPFPVPGLPAAQQAMAARMNLFALSFRDIEMGVREQFTRMFAASGFDAQRDIAGITANRWGHAYIVTPPGFYHGRHGQPSASDVIRRGFARIQFAHSELTGEQLWQTAAMEGERAAEAALKL